MAQAIKSIQLFQMLPVGRACYLPGLPSTWSGHAKTFQHMVCIKPVSKLEIPTHGLPCKVCLVIKLHQPKCVSLFADASLHGREETFEN